MSDSPSSNVSGIDNGVITPAGGEPSQQDVKPSTEHINLKVVGQDNNEVFFKIKKTTEFSKLMKIYCARQGKTMNSLRFLVDGERIRPDQTPAELDMEDGDQIEAVLEQLGGSN
ncbi:ubiquitin-like protein modifier SUMO [Schizosaccharomyces osmophilus]|uniref:Ubiquitin-like protein modifier SUMO n=1 Tax=Schizosaccharomyces osmophilus TaxID=2545709 RepID=A0AAE9WCT4_9SCHI|nr:ubiquitin-like protein modifier SUMO [Schizosaccharomyces osmophilus]WBW73889.1 ubiquitin-like protein modifier SUMO [Schizosaccharomyces osmophilus]